MTPLRPLGLLLLLCAISPVAHALIERKVEKKFLAPATGAVLAVDTFSGEIRVTETDGDSVESPCYSTAM